MNQALYTQTLKGSAAGHICTCALECLTTAGPGLHRLGLGSCLRTGDMALTLPSDEGSPCPTPLIVLRSA